MYFGDNLKDLIASKNIDAKTLRDETGLSNAVIYDTLNDKKIPNINSILKICKFFNCSIDYLLGRTDTYSNLALNEPLPFATTFNKLLNLNKTNINRVSLGTGIKTTNIYRWLNGLTKPSTDSLIKLADYFDCSVDYLVGIER